MFSVLDDLAAEIRPHAVNEVPEPVDLRPLLTEDIGYTVIRRNTAALLLGLSILLIVAVGIIVRRSRRPEIVGWAGPAVGIVFMSVFVFLGANSRQSVPPTIAIAAEVDGCQEVMKRQSQAYLRAYQPSSGPAKLESRDGAFRIWIPRGSKASHAAEFRRMHLPGTGKIYRCPLECVRAAFAPRFAQGMWLPSRISELTALRAGWKEAASGTWKMSS